MVYIYNIRSTYVVRRVSHSMYHHHRCCRRHSHWARCRMYSLDVSTQNINNTKKKNEQKISPKHFQIRSCNTQHVN